MTNADQRTRAGGRSVVAPMLSDARLAELLQLIKGADSVELKLSVPDSGRRSAVENLGMEVLDAQLRQVFFFDTPGLDLDRHGVVVRARRVQRKAGDSVVKLRPIVPANMPEKVRSAAGFTIEVDAMPGGFVCSGAMKGEVDNAEVKDAAGGRRAVRKLFSSRQRALFADHAPAGLGLDDLSILGPINVMKLKFTPGAYGRRLVAELWGYPDGSRILELSTKCEPRMAFDVAVETRAFLASHGIDLSGAQQTKTRKALRFFAKELADDGAK